MTSTTPIDRTDWDDAVRPADDFYRHVNGRWLAGHPVPPEYGAYGAFHEVNERNQDLLHRLLHEAADEPGAAGSVRHKVGDYFMAGTDEEAIAAAGTEPIREQLTAIDAIASAADARALAPRLERDGVGAFYGIGIAPDFADANAYLVYVGQGGLGLPDRDYYLKDDERSDAAARGVPRPRRDPAGQPRQHAGRRARGRATGSSRSSAGSPRRRSPRSSSATRS